jgi:DnaJ-class molecular chaperone
MKESELKQYLNPSLYKVLFIDRLAPQGIIKSSYRELSKTEHPDKSKDSAEVANKKFLVIKIAYEVLSNPQLKKQYDLMLEKHITAKNAKIIEDEVAKKTKVEKKSEIKIEGYSKELEKEVRDTLREGLEAIEKYRKENNF